MPKTMSKPANFKGSRDNGKEWFLMDITHPSNTVDAVSMVPSANSTSYFTLKVLTGKFSNLQNLLSMNDLSAPESVTTRIRTRFCNKCNVCGHVNFDVLNVIVYV